MQQCFCLRCNKAFDDENISIKQDCRDAPAMTLLIIKKFMETDFKYISMQNPA
jgi:hypothetical protein